MEKTKLGLPVGVLAAIMCLTGWFAGYVAAVLVAGYILIVEDNKVLKQIAVNVVCVMLAFSLASTVVNFIPTLIGVVRNLLSIFTVYFDLDFIDRIFNFFGSLLTVARILVFAFLTFMAVKVKTIDIPYVGKILD